MDNVRAWNENDENDEIEVEVANIGAELAVCFRIFSKALKNNWAPALGEETRRRLIQDMRMICNRVEEKCVGLLIPRGRAGAKGT